MTDQPADNSTPEPDGSSAETTATGAASETKTDPYAERFAALESKADAAQRAADGAARLAHQRDSEIYRLRQENQRYRQGSEGYGEQETTREPQPQGDVDMLRNRMMLLELNQRHPGWEGQYDSLKTIADTPAFASRFGSDLSNPSTFEAAYEVAENRRLTTENATLKAAQEKLNQARETRKSQAFVSGQGATPQREAIDLRELEKMTPAEMEKKFGKSVLARGFF